MEIEIDEEEREVLINVFEFFEYLNNIIQKYEIGE